jgi:hypothetical protein
MALQAFVQAWQRQGDRSFDGARENPGTLFGFHGRQSAALRYGRMQFCVTVAQIFNLLYRRIAFGRA